MREKIAEKLYSILYNNPSKHNMKEFSRHLADQILSLPVDGFDCTLGELPEQARKMKGALIDLISLADDAMREANNDGAEYDIEGELQDANDALTFKGSRIIKKLIPSSDGK